MKREEHLQWCKDRAEEYLKAGDHLQAWTSFASDMSKHDETKDNPAIMIGMQLLMMGSDKMTSVREVRIFINGFH